jgi:hypothetical protein
MIGQRISLFTEKMWLLAMSETSRKSDGMQQRWVARWTTSNGTPQECFFYSTHELMIARIDFMFKLIDMGIPRPNEYDLEEAHAGLPSIPRPVRFGGYL